MPLFNHLFHAFSNNNKHPLYIDYVTVQCDNGLAFQCGHTEVQVYGQGHSVIH